MKHKFAVSTNTYHGYTLSEALTGITKTGISAVELLAVRDWTEHVMADMPKEELCSIRKDIVNKGLVSVAMSGHCNIMGKEGYKAFVKNIELAQFFRCKYIITELGENHSKRAGQEKYNAQVKVVKELANLCAKKDIILAFETRGQEYGTGKSIFDFLNDVDEPNATINYDAANIIFFKGYDPITDLKECVSKVSIVHLKDKAGASNEWNFPALGSGELDVKRILEILPEKVLISVDIEFTEQGAKNVEEVHQAVLDSYNYLMNIEQCF